MTQMTVNLKINDTTRHLMIYYFPKNQFGAAAIKHLKSTAIVLDRFSRMIISDQDAVSRNGIFSTHY